MATRKEAARLKGKTTAEIIDDEIPKPPPRKRAKAAAPAAADAFPYDDDFSFA
jgi:hypothetical protein